MQVACGADPICIVRVDNDPLKAMALGSFIMLRTHWDFRKYAGIGSWTAAGPARGKRSQTVTHSRIDRARKRLLFQRPSYAPHDAIAHVSKA